MNSMQGAWCHGLMGGAAKGQACAQQELQGRRHHQHARVPGRAVLLYALCSITWHAVTRAAGQFVAPMPVLIHTHTG
jgi:hypothetical protein